MEPEIKATIAIALATVLLGGGFVTGCTYVVTENNRQYYETMRQCVESGGSFVPTRGDNSSAACIRR